MYFKLIMITDEYSMKCSRPNVLSKTISWWSHFLVKFEVEDFKLYEKCTLPHIFSLGLFLEDICMVSSVIFLLSNLNSHF